MIAAAERAATLLALAVALAVALDAAPVVRRLRGGEGDVPVAAPAAAPPVDLAALRHFAPFGRAASAGSGDAAGGLQLRGILLARPAANSTALIAAAGGPVRGYAVGAVLPGGAILDSVEFDLVVLRAGGQLVTLALPAKPGGAGDAGLPVVPATAPAGADPVAAHLDSPAPDRLTLLGSLGAAAGPGGLRVGAALPDDVRRAGLLPGDTIERVDGVAIGNPDHDRAVFDNAVVAGRMRVDVVRRGRPLTLTVTLH